MGYYQGLGRTAAYVSAFGFGLSLYILTKMYNPQPKVKSLEEL